MKVLLHNQRVWDAWFFGSIFLVLAGFIAFGLWFVRNDTVAQIKAEMERLRAEQVAADREREEIKQTVRPLRGLSNAIEAVKDATEPKVEGRP